MKQVNQALRADDRLNGASVYTAAPGVVVLYGPVFDKHDRQLAEQVQAEFAAFTRSDSTLKTTTGNWREEARINDTLILNDLEGVSVTLIGRQAYLSGQVGSQAEKDRAAQVATSQSNLHIENLVRVVPGPLFSSSSNLF